MRQGNHVRVRKSRIRFWLIFFVLLFAVILSLTLIFQHVRKKALLPPASAEQTILDAENSTNKQAEAVSPLPPEAKPEIGTLLESGNKISNFYSVFDYDGAVSDITDSSFAVGKAGMAFDNEGQLISPAVTVCYNDETIVKTATLYNSDDRYEIYAANMKDLKGLMNEEEFLDSVLIVLDNSHTEELLAKEITIYHFADLG